MTNEQLLAAPSKILHFPTVLGAVVPVYNIPNVKAALKFSGSILADMILGVDPGEDNAFGFGVAKTSNSRGLTNSLFTSEMLALLSQARQGSGRG